MMDEPRQTLICSRSWTSADSELAFVTRSLAGAASRHSEVVVVVPSPAGSITPDGAFDLAGAGWSGPGEWPAAGHAVRPAQLRGAPTVIVDEADAATLRLAKELAPGRAVAAVAGRPAAPGVRPLRFSGAPEGKPAEVIGVHIPVNPLAAQHRFNGLGFPGYLLVLSDRAGAPEPRPPTEMAAWLTARFPAADVVVIENGSAAVWRGRALRGEVNVDTRTDLWRLLAHAKMTIDLAPGEIVARECVESLRFGTPIVVPSVSAACPHADAGGGMSYRGFSDLLRAVETLGDDEMRAGAARRGRIYADARYGDPVAFVDQVARQLGLAPAL